MNFAGADARRAGAYAAAGAVHQRVNRLQVQVPAPLGDVMGVTDAVAELRTAAAHFANSCHKDGNLLLNSKRRL